MPLTYKIVTKGLANITKASGKELLRKSLTTLGTTWHTIYSPLHFQALAQNRYHYKSRSARYVASVEKEFGRWLPNLRSGKMMESVATRFKITPASSGDMTVKVAMQRAHPSKRFVSEEIVQINDKEIKELMVAFRTQFTKDIAAIPQKEVKVN